MTDKDQKPDVRAEIAKRIITYSPIGLVLLALFVIAAGVWIGPDSLEENTRLVFNALLPLFGTWVGAVIAFYFSRENFESASKSVSAANEAVRDMAAQTLERLRAINVRDIMVPRTKMQVLQLGQTEDPEAQINFRQQVLERFVVPVTRLPVLGHDDRFRYMIHESMAYKFVSDQWRQGTGLSDNATLQDFLNHKDMRDLVSKAIAFVAATETLADAKAEMEHVQRCQDRDRDPGPQARGARGRLAHERRHRKACPRLNDRLAASTFKEYLYSCG